MSKPDYKITYNQISTPKEDFSRFIEIILELARRGVREYPLIFAPTLGKLHKLSETGIHDIISRIPDDWMSPLAKQFARELMLYNLQELRKLTDE